MIIYLRKYIWVYDGVPSKHNDVRFEHYHDPKGEIKTKPCCEGVWDFIIKHCTFPYETKVPRVCVERVVDRCSVYQDVKHCPFCGEPITIEVVETQLINVVEKQTFHIGKVTEVKEYVGEVTTLPTFEHRCGNCDWRTKLDKNKPCYCCKDYNKWVAANTEEIEG